MAPSVINSARSRVRRNPSPTPCGITISHQGFMTKLLGNNNGMAKLNPDVVREIRQAAKLRVQLTNKGLARKYNVSEGAIRNVLKGARWKWVQ